MLGQAEDVGISVRPDFAAASKGDNLVDDEETKVEVGFPATDAVLRPGPILEDLHAPLVDEDIGGLTNFQAEFAPHHSRQFGPFPDGYHHGVHWRERHVLQFFLAVGIRAESLVAVKDANFVGGNSGGAFVSCQAKVSTAIELRMLSARSWALVHSTVTSTGSSDR